MVIDESVGRVVPVILRFACVLRLPIVPVDPLDEAPVDGLLSLTLLLPVSAGPSIDDLGVADPEAAVEEEADTRAPLDVPRGVTLNLRSFSFSTTRSSIPSSSVPSPNARTVLGFFSSLGPVPPPRTAEDDEGRMRDCIEDGEATRAKGTGEVLDCLDAL